MKSASPPFPIPPADPGDAADDVPPVLCPLMSSCSKCCLESCFKSKIRTPIVETVDKDSFSNEPPSLCARPSPSNDDDSLLDLFASEDVLGINSIDVHLSGLPMTDDNDLVDDPSLDVDDSEFAHPPWCCCSSPMSPIDQFLFNAAVLPFPPFP